MPKGQQFASSAADKDAMQMTMGGGTEVELERIGSKNKGGSKRMSM